MELGSIGCRLVARFCRGVLDETLRFSESRQRLRASAP
jgi:hypothetical protein